MAIKTPLHQITQRTVLDVTDPVLHDRELSSILNQKIPFNRHCRWSYDVRFSIRYLVLHPLYLLNPGSDTDLMCTFSTSYSTKSDA